MAGFEQPCFPMGDGVVRKCNQDCAIFKMQAVTWDACPFGMQNSNYENYKDMYEAGESEEVEGNLEELMQRRQNRRVYDYNRLRTENKALRSKLNRRGGGMLGKLIIGGMSDIICFLGLIWLLLFISEYVGERK